MQEIIYDVQPEVIIEIGCRFGGSAVIWGMLLAEMNPHAKVVSIDVDDKSNRVRFSDDPHCQGVCSRARLTKSWKRMVDFVHGSSTDPKLAQRVADKYLRGNKATLVLLDSDHTMAHVLGEMELWGGLVTPGSYMVVQDSNVNGNPVLPQHGPGPLEAIHEYQRRHPDSGFVVDGSREYLKFHMHKYLLRQ